MLFLPPFIQLLILFRFCCSYIISLSRNSVTSTHLAGLLIPLRNCFLAMQELFILMRSHLFILSFMSLALRDVSVRMLLRGMSEIFLPMLSSRTFMVLQLIFKSFIHLEFIFVYGVGWRSSFIFLHVAVQISQHHLLKRLFLLHFMLLPPLSNIN